MDLSEANLQVDRVVKLSFESTIITNSSIDFTKTFPSSMDSPSARVSVEVTEFTGRCDLWEVHDRVCNEELELESSKRRPERCYT